MPSNDSHRFGFFPGERPPSRWLSSRPYPDAAQATPPARAAFIFYIHDIDTGLGHPGAVFELFSLNEATRQIAHSGPTGRVSFSVAVGQPYMLMKKGDPSAHAAGATKYHVYIKKDGSAVVDGHCIPHFVLYHSRSAASFSAAYSGNGGVGQYLDGGLALNEFYAIKSPKAVETSKPDHEFVCWNTAADGSGTIYLPGSMILMSKTLTLYAQWTPSNPSAHSVIYDPNGGVGGRPDVGEGEEQCYSVQTAEEAGVSHPSYAFKTWNTEPDGSGTTFAPGTSLVISANLALYAQWESL